MRRIIKLTGIAAALIVCGCTDICRDEIVELRKEIDVLKSQIGQINTNISSLQSIVKTLQNEDYVTSVIPVTESGKEIGYIINFQNSGPVTIYHGKDGRNGTDGKDGYVPVIGVRQYTDCQWYWTIDGEWLKDDSGNMICANGRTGIDGQDGITPELKIQDGFWYVSYDNGGIWTKLDKVSGEDETSGESIFQIIDVTSSNEFVRLVMADGTELRLQRYAGISIVLSEQNDIEIARGETKMISYEIKGTSGAPKVSVSSVNGLNVGLHKSSSTSGTIAVTAPVKYVDGTVTILVCEGQNTVMEVLTFNTIAVDSVSLDRTSASLNEGDNVTLTATVSPINATDKRVIWSSGNASVATVDQSGKVTALEAGDVIIMATTVDGGYTAECKVSVCIPYTGIEDENGYTYVDLGLSVKWANYNVGAGNPGEYGDYFAWGETEPYYEPGYAQSESPVWKSGYPDGYDLTSYKWFNGSDDTFTKYCTNSSAGTVDNKTVLDSSDDVAHVKWGGSWRMPTIEEFDELINNCTWTWTTQNGLKGYKVTSKKSGYTSKSIFLPAAGARGYDNIVYVGSRGFYWSSSLGSGTSEYAYDLYLSLDLVSADFYDSRSGGRSVRPVLE